MVRPRPAALRLPAGTRWNPAGPRVCSRLGDAVLVFVFVLRPPLVFLSPLLQRTRDSVARYRSSSKSTFFTFSASAGSGGVENQASRISRATVSVVVRRLKQRTLAWFQALAPRAVSASPQSAALAPGTLFADMQTPVPVQQKRTPSSASPEVTAPATAAATSGQAVPVGPPEADAREPNKRTWCPRLRSSRSTKSVTCDFSSLPRAMRNRDSLVVQDFQSFAPASL